MQYFAPLNDTVFLEELLDYVNVTFDAILAVNNRDFLLNGRADVSASASVSALLDVVLPPLVPINITCTTMDEVSEAIKSYAPNTGSLGPTAAVNCERAHQPSSLSHVWCCQDILSCMLYMHMESLFCTHCDAIAASAQEKQRHAWLVRPSQPCALGPA
jgi:hypothetical protein